MSGGLLKTLAVIHWLALCLWIAAIAAAGVAAVGVFGTMGELRLDVGAYAAFPNDANQHAMLAAGRIMERVFFMVDLAQFIAMPLLVIAATVLAILKARGWRGAGAMIRHACLALAVATLVYQAAAINPVMNRELRAYWAGAASGDVPGALDHQQAFNRLHRRAEMLMNARLALLLAALVMLAAASAPRPTQPTMLQRPLLRDRS